MSVKNTERSKTKCWFRSSLDHLKINSAVLEFEKTFNISLNFIL